MDPSTLGPLDWFAVPANGQGLMLALIAALCMSVATLLYRTSGLLSVLIGVVTAALLTSIAIPIMASYFHLSWPWWPVIGLFNGVASLRVVRTIDAFAERLEKRLPDAGADRITALVRGGASADPPNEPGAH